jgi:hypothetical protein
VGLEGFDGSAGVLTVANDFDTLFAVVDDDVGLVDGKLDSPITISSHGLRDAGIGDG